jgi:hypothetical protein
VEKFGSFESFGCVVACAAFKCAKCVTDLTFKQSGEGKKINFRFRTERFSVR